MYSELVQHQLSWLRPVEVRCFRLIVHLSRALQTGDWNLSTLRGAWGNQLRALDSGVYERVFNGVGGAAKRQTLYTFRPDLDVYGNVYDGTDSALQIPFQWTLFNVPSSDLPFLIEAWKKAGQAGIGSHRDAFTLRGMPIPIHPDADSPSLGEVRWPFESADTPIRLVFPFSVSLTQNAHLNTQPSLKDIVIAILNRLGFLHCIAVSENLDQMQFPKRNDETWPEFAPQLLALADSLPHDAWQGKRQDLSRYSGRQKRLVDVQGVAGYLSLPSGVGDLWPILSAASWTQIGKSATQGLGRPSFLGME